MQTVITSRRQFLATWCANLASIQAVRAAEENAFSLRYILGSCMYGHSGLRQVLPEVAKIGASAIDIWPRVHGRQREEIDELGEDRFSELLRMHGVQLGCITQYALGPFGLQNEMRLAQRLGCRLLVTGGRGPVGLKGNALKQAVGQFVEALKPHLEVAEQTGTTIAIENHGNNLIDTPDSLKWLIDQRPSSRIAVALAPYHLPQHEQLLARLIRDLGNGIQMFYAWQHGMGCMKKLPKHQELLQMPGRGRLDFAPLVQALRDIRYDGWTEIFMHPFPRGIPILPSTRDVTIEINRSRTYLDALVRQGRSAIREQ